MKTKWYEVELNEEYASYIGYDFCDKCYGQFDTLTEARKFMKKVFKSLKKEIKGFERYKKDLEENTITIDLWRIKTDPKTQDELEKDLVDTRYVCGMY